MGTSRLIHVRVPVGHKPWCSDLTVLGYRAQTGSTVCKNPWQRPHSGTLIKETLIVVNILYEGGGGVFVGVADIANHPLMANLLL